MAKTGTKHYIRLIQDFSLPVTDDLKKRLQELEGNDIAQENVALSYIKKGVEARDAKLDVHTRVQ